MPPKEKEATSSIEDKQQSGADGAKGNEGESDQQQSESKGDKVEEEENDQQAADLDSTKEDDQSPLTSEGEGEKVEKKRKGCSKDEVLAVLAHELGHWKCSHNLINLSIGEVSRNDSWLYLLSAHTQPPTFRLIYSSLCSCLDSL